MSIYLTIAGRSYDVLIGGVKKKPHNEQIGKKVRTFSGPLRSTERDTKKQWTFALAPIDVLALELLELDVAKQKIVAVGGLFIVRTGTLNASVELTEAAPAGDETDAWGFKWLVTLTITEA